LDYYGRDAHLSQSAQLQLEALVLRLRRPVYTINNSFREENYDDPESKGRRLSEFTLIEPERPFEELSHDEALDEIIKDINDLVRNTTASEVLFQCDRIENLGGDIDYLDKALDHEFPRITYDEALDLLNKQGENYKFGDDLGTLEERAILKHFGNIPTFVTHHPASIKFFNMKRTPDGERVYSVDLLASKLGEIVGGAVREEDGEVIKQQLRESKIGRYLKENGWKDPTTAFAEYFNIFEQEEPLLRGGFGIGFERLIGFLLQSNDILDTIAYRTLHPHQE
jgi:asparaginyl-tRNA synthetase